MSSITLHTFIPAKIPPQHKYHKPNGQLDKTNFWIFHQVNAPQSTQLVELPGCQNAMAEQLPVLKKSGRVWDTFFILRGVFYN